MYIQQKSFVEDVIFLKFKWHQVRIVYYMFMLWQVIFSVIYTGYVYQLYRYRFDT